MKEKKGNRTEEEKKRRNELEETIQIERGQKIRKPNQNRACEKN